MRRRKLFHLAGPVLLAAGLAACGGTALGPGGPASSTPSPSPSEKARYGFILIGDFGTQDLSEAAVAARAKIWVRTRAFDGFVTLGDNVYGSGDPDDFRAAWTKPYGWVDRRGVPVVWTLGNHDIETRDGRPEIKFFHMPGRWYAQTIGPVEFVVLDANQPDSREQRKWLRSTLAASDAPWTVVVFHQPAYSCGSHGSTPEVQSQWVPLFRRFHVSVVVNGHDHDYQRFPPQRGVTYVVEGEGGAGLYEVGECPEGTPDPVVADDTHHGFLYLSATTRKLTGRAVSDDGTVLDTFVLRNR